ncbi:MAG: CoA pyrophosphatase [Verrucomicrobiota bacterium]
MNPSLSHIRRALDQYSPRDLAESQELAHAAVALILREDHETADQTEVLMIRRAEHPHDPWSGHMGFPGGRADAQDESLERTAIRETKEELGVCLDSCAERLGRLSELRARSKMQALPLSIYPYICRLTKPAPLELNHEVNEALWIPLEFFLSPENRDQMEHPVDATRSVPCYRFRDHVIWGLSLAMLDELVNVMQSGVPENA